MEKYYIVTEESSLHHDYMSFLENGKKVNELVKAFMKKHQIETRFYAPSDEKLYIQPSEIDVQKFNSILTKPLENGLRAFKKNSTIGKDWINTLKENNIKVSHKPFVPMYFTGVYGHLRTRLFQIEGTVYCSIEGEFRHLDTPKGMEEIKASEFFKIIEDNEEKNDKAGENHDERH